MVKLKYKCFSSSGTNRIPLDNCRGVFFFHINLCNTPKEKHNNPLENYHTAAQEHNRVHGSNMNHSNRLTEFYWSEINISQTEPCERI
jgi:hypothetical protein